jgi:hypothetical protein
VLPLPLSALKASSPVLGNPLNRHRAIPLTYDSSGSRSPTSSARKRRANSMKRSPSACQVRSFVRPSSAAAPAWSCWS